MEGFQEEKEDEQVEGQPGILKYIEILNEEKAKEDKKVKKMKMNILVTSGLLALLAIGGLIIWNRVSHHWTNTCMQHQGVSESMLNFNVKSSIMSNNFRNEKNDIFL